MNEYLSIRTRAATVSYMKVDELYNYHSLEVFSTGDGCLNG